MKHASFLIICVFLAVCCIGAGCVQSRGNGTTVPQPSGTAIPVQAGTPVVTGHYGTGNMSLQVPLNYGVYNVGFQNNGTGLFLVEISSTEFYQQVVRGDGPVTGSQAAGIPESGMYWLNVTSGGAWDVTIGRPGTNTPPAPPLTLSGNGDYASGFITLAAGNVTFVMTNNGTGPFAVWLYNETGNFVFDPSGTYVMPLPNHYGPYDNQVTVAIPARGRYVISVVSDGSWDLGVG